ncbi:MAG: hypothetical protein KF893_22725 [Caldilineaceae bacterium]|nr:hypothetical protein [Caldilineaceae bacterium]
MTIRTAPWLLLFGRTALFVIVQSIFAIGFLLAGASTTWDQGANWWPFSVTITNLICLIAMIALYRAEGKNYWEIFRIRRQTLGGDLLVLLGSMLIIGSIGFFPNVWLASWLFEDSQIALDLLVRPLPLWAAYASLLLFPITQGLVELALYFTYVMPRLDARPFPDLRPVILPALMLGFQHFAIPLIFDSRFLLWRGLMYVPFAFAIGVMLHWRPRLLPYFAIIHVLMDLSFAIMLLAVAIG